MGSLGVSLFLRFLFWMCFLFTSDVDLCTKTKMSALKRVINIEQYTNQSYSCAHCKETDYYIKILLTDLHTFTQLLYHP